MPWCLRDGVLQGLFPGRRLSADCEGLIPVPRGGVRRGMRTLVLAVTAVAALVLLAGLAGTGSGEWAGRAEGATSAGPRGGQSGDEVGARLHDSSKGFGERLLGGIKFVGRTVI